MNKKLEEYFGENTFSESVMEERLPADVYMQLKKTIETGAELAGPVAEVIATAMKEWAIEHGATHFTHWFAPMTGITAEKHDSFISPAPKGRIVMEFSGKELIKGESDASSFPSGGLRATFEARGYTAWDCTSPAFLKQDAGGVTLCIPTAFCSYTGEALDKKTPLLRSMEAISNSSVRILRLFGRDDVKKVSVSVGGEQEYFLIDREKYLLRDDLIYTGRTLFGAMPPKGQEMDDHYFGALKERIASFMKELNEELWKLGIYARTQHNEAAPAQHELAPVFTTANIATDHNQLIMDNMKKIAARHGLTCLLHEKPFAGVNGSGKHNNWSLVTDKGENLLKPGKEPHNNLQFLIFLAAVIKAVDTYPELLRLSASNPGNDSRLGANEAPPAIVSIFIGEQLEDILAQFEKNGEATSSLSNSRLTVGVHTLPWIKKDANDRNRTSPIAFTGNKFEFRMVASSLSLADPNCVLNTIVADVLDGFADEIEDALRSQEEENDLTGMGAQSGIVLDGEIRQDVVNRTVKSIIARTVSEHKRIIFAGNGYSEEWIEEAARRGLPNLPSIVDAIPVLTRDDTIGVFERKHVLSEAELASRAEITYDIYSKTMNIEARTMIEMASRQYIPAVISYIKDVAKCLNQVREAVPEADVSVEKELVSKCSMLLKETRDALDRLQTDVDKKKVPEGSKEKAEYFRRVIVPEMESLRQPVDELERIVDGKLWPVPNYGDLIFEV